eukprot:SAG11_NODE_2425_length_3378_cov_2.513118_3_plen_78_part_00
MNDGLKKAALPKDEAHKLGGLVRPCACALFPTTCATLDARNCSCCPSCVVQIQLETDKANKQVEEVFAAKEEDIMHG